MIDNQKNKHDVEEKGEKGGSATKVTEEISDIEEKGYEKELPETKK